MNQIFRLLYQNKMIKAADFMLDTPKRKDDKRMTGNSYSGSELLMLTLCFEEDIILVSKAILNALEQPRHIQMLINEEQQKLLLHSCTANDREAVVIPRVPMQQFEINGHILLRRIQKLTRWEDIRPRVIYGNYIPMHNAIVFDLRTAQPAQLQIPLTNITCRMN